MRALFNLQFQIWFIKSTRNMAPKIVPTHKADENNHVRNLTNVMNRLLLVWFDSSYNFEITYIQ